LDLALHNQAAYHMEDDKIERIISVESMSKQDCFLFNRIRKELDFTI
jgi:hypothetical protein